MIVVDIMRSGGLIDDTEWNFFLRGAAGVEGSLPVKPDVEWLSEHDWKMCCNLEVCYLCNKIHFKGVCCNNFTMKWRILLKIKCIEVVYNRGIISAVTFMVSCCLMGSSNCLLGSSNCLFGKEYIFCLP